MRNSKMNIFALDPKARQAVGGRNGQYENDDGSRPGNQEAVQKYPATPEVNTASKPAVRNVSGHNKGGVLNNSASLLKAVAIIQ